MRLSAAGACRKSPRAPLKTPLYAQEQSRIARGSGMGKMFNRYLAHLLALLLALFAQPAQAFWDPPYVTPTNPLAGQSVSVYMRGGGCDTLVSQPGYPQISRQGSAIRIVYFSFHYDTVELCTLPVGGAALPFGSYPAGSYTLQVDVFYYDGFSEPHTVTIGIAPFTVAANQATAIPAPVNNGAWLAILVSALASLGCVVLQQRRDALLSVLLLLVSFSARSQDAPQNKTIEVLLSTAPSAPTSQQLVDYYSHFVGAPPLRSLVEMPANSAQFLLQHRAGGDFLQQLEAHPDSPRAMLERYLLLTYPANTDIARALLSVRADPYVAAAYEPLIFEPSSVSLAQFSVTHDDVSVAGSQYGRDDLNIDAAWKIAGGYAQIGMVDTGLYEAHAALVQFTGSGASTTFAGGNFVAALSRDVGYTGLAVPSGFDETKVDEAKTIDNSDTSCPLGVQAPINASHGTHTAGLIAANGASGQGVQGTCKHCGIAMVKVAATVCSPTLGKVILGWNNPSVVPAMATNVDNGVQILSMSFGNAEPANTTDFCVLNASNPLCLKLAYAKDRDTVMVASSGNDRLRLNSPASDKNVVAVGGFDSALALWDESPGGDSSCPVSTTFAFKKECGSNYTTVSYLPRQELMGSAKSVVSTTYPSKDWSPDTKCGDSFPGPAGSGVGLCTGTSMSAPQVSGVFGILRSINPLVKVGADPTIPGNLRNVAAMTASGGGSWSQTMGYGRPDAAKAAMKMLGTVAGVPVRNRATPLFRLRNSTNFDYADTTSPQFAASLEVNQTTAWHAPTTATGVPGYLNFPHGVGESTDQPSASIYILTTEYSPRTEYPALIPVYLMRKAKGTGFDYLLSTKGDLVNLHSPSYGYSLLTIQGYIYQPCPPAFEASCMPPGTKPLYRSCKAAEDDCATFFDTEADFSLYTTTRPTVSGTTKTLLGYAYTSGDTDNDGLPDALEYVIGTDRSHSDSDNDGVPDNTEYPFTGVPANDPCAGATGTGSRFCPADVIFANGFNP